MTSGLLIYLAIVLTPVVLTWLALRVPSLLHAIRERHRQPLPEGLPIERLAADLRRVHRDLLDLAPDAPIVRRRATRQAYDALLAQACTAVGVNHELDAVPEGVEREMERLRLEECLRQAGLAIP